uniref:Uncharacterized protein n=1 Tax=Anguilla anguilla TaxID=7936 RepID=A0A0E9QQA3_ANGAN
MYILNKNECIRLQCANFGPSIIAHLLTLMSANLVFCNCVQCSY